MSLQTPDAGTAGTYGTDFLCAAQRLPAKTEDDRFKCMKYHSFCHLIGLSFYPRVNVISYNSGLSFLDLEIIINYHEI